MEVQHLYASNNLVDLFIKEQELTEVLTPYCNKTGKEIEFLYSLSVYSIWFLKIIIDERTE